MSESTQAGLLEKDLYARAKKPFTKNEKQTNKQQYVILFSKVFILVARKDATKCKADDETADSNEGVKESKVFQLLWGKKNLKRLGQKHDTED